MLSVVVMAAVALILTPIITQQEIQLEPAEVAAAVGRQVVSRQETKQIAGVTE